MPSNTQAKLLRTLQNQEVTRVGSLTPRKVNVRVIAATNRNVEEMIAQKQFREDLYYRLSMVELRTPALADRRIDLPLLEKFLLDRFSKEFNKSIRGLTLRAQSVLSRHSWPGNIRELENVLGRACMMASSDIIDVHDLPPSLRHNLPAGGATAGSPSEFSLAAKSAVSFDDHEKELLGEALYRTNSNQSEAARILSISRDRLRYKMAKYNLR
jgi:DNA-binding NtrC family response regulator